MQNDRKYKIKDEARTWFMKITSDESTDEDIESFEKWRNEKTSHQKAYAKVSQIGNELNFLGRSPQGENLRKSLNEKPLRQNPFVHFLQNVKDLFGHTYLFPAGATVIIIALFFFIQLPVADQVRIYQTNIAEVKTITLPDQSLMTLGANTRVKMLYSDEGRKITLLQGQAFFDVMKNVDKPFYVSSRNTEIKVLGTKFDVHLGQNQLTIGVLEGRVQVKSSPVINQPPHAGNNMKILLAGQVISASKNGFTEKVKEAVIEPGAWREGRLEYKEALFSKVIGDANRYYKGDIILKDKILANTLVTTSLNVNQISIFLNVLPDIFDVDVKYLKDGKVLITQKNKR